MSSPSTLVGESFGDKHKFDASGSKGTWKDSESASIWSESTVDGLRPTRLYQFALLFAGFMTTFQTIGMNQSYGVFQVNPLIKLSQ